MNGEIKGIIWEFTKPLLAVGFGLLLGTAANYWALKYDLSHPKPCSTDWDCCKRNPAICKVCDPGLYREVWKK